MSLNYMSVQNNKCLLSTCNLNQWALDFDGNLARITESIKIAKSHGSKYRLGPELEICGYSCEDHFLELDTFMHCDQSLAVILEGDLTVGILCDIGCPILHNNVRYNCRVLCLDRKIIHIRPKVYLADDGNYREKRFFTSWNYLDHKLHDHMLSDLLRKVTNQTTVPIGLGIIATEETTLACEVCEELWSAKSPHISLYLSGVEIVTNGSGSHHVLRKLNSRLSLMKNATSKCGGAYVFANQRGCDGNRLYFDGSSLICVNGEIVAQASQFSLKDVEVISAVVDLESIRSFRNGPASLQEQSSQEPQLPVISLRHFSLRANKSVTDNLQLLSAESPALAPHIHLPEEECAMGPACWLWDYLRRSGAAGFLLPLSGGADSSSVAAIVRVMCMMVAQAALEGNTQVITDLRRMFVNNNINSELVARLKGRDVLHISSADAQSLTADSTSEDALAFTAEDRVSLANELCYQVLHTVYLGTSNSSTNTQDRAKRLANSIHSYHNTLFIDDVVSAVLRVFCLLAGKTPLYESQGGTPAEDLALQNIQARLRMVMSYLCAQLFPWLRGNKGFLLVLGSANVDEALRGYMTKYDCSSADINPIGGMSKGDLKKMMLWAAKVYDLPVLEDVAHAAPTAELRPSAVTNGERSEDSTQTDEADMGMTYAELGVFGYLRKVLRCGPVKMFVRLTELWKNLTPSEVAVKVKRFFYFYSVNRHKLTTLTPSYHAESYSPDDNRFDLRQFLYNTKWTRQFNTIDSILQSASPLPPAPSRPVTVPVPTQSAVQERPVSAVTPVLTRPTSAVEIPVASRPVSVVGDSRPVSAAVVTVVTPPPSSPIPSAPSGIKSVSRPSSSASRLSPTVIDDSSQSEKAVDAPVEGTTETAAEDDDTELFRDPSEANI